MIRKIEKKQIRSRVHKRIRRKLSGTAARPRLAVFRSEAHIYAQVIDDGEGKTLVSASTVAKVDSDAKGSDAKGGGAKGSDAKAGDAKAKKANGGNVAAAKTIGKLVAERAQEKGIKSVVFDRGGFQYHGRIKALADAAREAGLEF